MKIIGLLAAGCAAVGFAHIGQAQDTGQSDDDLINIQGDRSAPTETAAPADVQTIAVPEPLPMSVSANDDPVGLARIRSPFDLIADDAELLKRLERKNMMHKLRGIDVPFRLLMPTDADLAAHPATRVWHKGKMPKKTLLARLYTRPISEAATTITDKEGREVELRLAEAAWRSTNDPKPVFAQSGAIYCSKAAKEEEDKDTVSLGDFCLVDEDVDGTFDAFVNAEGETRRGTVHGLHIVGPPLPLATPAPYTIAADNTLTHTVEWHTCGKDWDRPLFVRHIIEGKTEMSAETDIRARRWGSYCEKAGENISIVPLEKKAIVSELGPLALEIGSKKRGAKATIRKLLDDSTEYREESGKIVPTTVGMTPMHVRIATVQQFDIKPYLFDGRQSRAEGEFGTDEVFLTLGFRHGYTGVVDSDVVIRTLLSKRSVEEGAFVYAVPAEKRTVLVGGYAGETILGPQVKRTMNTALVWCLPDREEKPIKIRKNRSFVETGEVEVIWTATCLPENSAGNHTVLKDQSPALAVNNLRMEASISTNDGPPPVTQTEQADFGAPLSFRYRVKSVSKRLVTLTEEVMLGDEVTSSKEVLLAILGKDGAPVTAAGGQFLLKITEGEDGADPKFTLEELRPVEEGESARVQGVDIMAMLRALLAQER